MKNGDKERLSHTTNPLHLARRLLETRTDLHPEDLSHALKFLHDIAGRCGDDPRQLAIARSLVTVHAELIHVDRRLVNCKPGSQAHSALVRSSMTMARHEAHLLKLVGLQRRERRAHEKAETGSVFSASSLPRPDEPITESPVAQSDADVAAA